MKTTESPHDLFFDQLRDMLSMEMQVLEALPELIRLCHHQSLRDLLMRHLGQVEVHLTDIAAVFTRFPRSPGSDKCKAVEGLVEGGEVHLKAVSHQPTRDLMMIAHCLRITHYAIAACEITGRLAERLGLLREARTLATILAREKETAKTLLDLEPGIFHLANLSSDEIPA